MKIITVVEQLYVVTKSVIFSSRDMENEETKAMFECKQKCGPKCKFFKLLTWMNSL